MLGQVRLITRGMDIFTTASLTKEEFAVDGVRVGDRVASMTIDLIKEEYPNILLDNICDPLEFYLEAAWDVMENQDKNVVSRMKVEGKLLWQTILIALYSTLEQRQGNDPLAELMTPLDKGIRFVGDVLSKGVKNVVIALSDATENPLTSVEEAQLLFVQEFNTNHGSWLGNDIFLQQKREVDASAFNQLVKEVDKYGTSCLIDRITKGAFERTL
jgi:hypothetical protein